MLEIIAELLQLLGIGRHAVADGFETLETDLLELEGKTRGEILVMQREKSPDAVR